MHKLKGSELLNTESFAKSFIYMDLWVCAAACQASLEFKNFVVAKADQSDPEALWYSVFENR